MDSEKTVLNDFSNEAVWRQPIWHNLATLTKRHICYFKTAAEEFRYEHVKHYQTGQGDPIKVQWNKLFAI